MEQMMRDRENNAISKPSINNLYIWKTLKVSGRTSGDNDNQDDQNDKKSKIMRVEHDQRKIIQYLLLRRLMQICQRNLSSDSEAWVESYAVQDDERTELTSSTGLIYLSSNLIKWILVGGHGRGWSTVINRGCATWWGCISGWGSVRIKYWSLSV